MGLWIRITFFLIRTVCCLSLSPVARSCTVNNSCDSHDRPLSKTKLAFCQEVVGVKMVDNLAVDDWFSSFTDVIQGDGSLIFRPVLVTLLEDWYDAQWARMQLNCTKIIFYVIIFENWGFMGTLTRRIWLEYFQRCMTSSWYRFQIGHLNYEFFFK